MHSIARRQRHLLVFWILAALVLPVAGESAASQRADVEERVRRAGVAFRELREVPDKRIPAELFARSRCVAVIPNVLKAAWVFGGRYGKGVLSCRSKTGEWSPPVIVMMTGGSFGLQFGASSTDVVLFFMTTGSVRSLLSNKVKLSGDAGVAAGPVGRETEAATDGKFTAEIYSYARSRGLFAGVSLAGSYLGVHREDTDAYYGQAYTPAGILFDHKVTSVPKSAWAFLNTLPRGRTMAKPAAPARAPEPEREEPELEYVPAPAPPPPVRQGPANRQLAPVVPPSGKPKTPVAEKPAAPPLRPPPPKAEIKAAPAPAPLEDFEGPPAPSHLAAPPPPANEAAPVGPLRPPPPRTPTVPPAKPLPPP